MYADYIKEFKYIVDAFKGYVHKQHALGVETLPSSEAKTMGKILDTMIENLPLEKRKTEFRSDTLDEVRRVLGDCRRCNLYNSRKHIVFGKGTPRASLVFVGEAPGREEDVAGEPFVGEAGQLLTRIIHAIKLRREDVYITNVIKCRPPKNRDPQPEEIKSCLPFLERQLQVIRPRLICALGKCAAHSLLETTEKISRLRGKIFEFQAIKVVSTFHPASLLRNPQWKRYVWQDMQLIQKLLEEDL